MAAVVEFPFSYGKPELTPKHYGRIDPSIFWSRGRIGGRHFKLTFFVFPKKE
jgi:hypothetical protein